MKLPRPRSLRFNPFRSQDIMFICQHILVLFLLVAFPKSHMRCAVACFMLHHRPWSSVTVQTAFFRPRHLGEDHILPRFRLREATSLRRSHIPSFFSSLLSRHVHSVRTPLARRFKIGMCQPVTPGEEVFDPGQVVSQAYHDAADARRSSADTSPLQRIPRGRRC